MTRIKKRRSGKKKTSDALRSAAGKRRARKAEKDDATPKGAGASGNDATAKKSLTPKKKYAVVQGGRRSGRAAGKNAAAFKEPRATGDAIDKKTTPFKNAATGKATGKTRSAGARRVAVSRSVANTFKKKDDHKKTTTPAAAAASKKQGKGFAPWAKNKFKKKQNGE